MVSVRARRADKVPTYIRMADELEGEILRGDYGAGDRLPTEHALAAEYRVNRHTAAQALNHLQSKGLVHRVKGRGSFVRPGRVDYRVAEKMSFSDSVSRLGLRPAQRILGVRRVRAHERLAGKVRVPVGEPLVAYERVRYAGEIPLVPWIHDLLKEGCSSVRAHYGLEVYRASSLFEIEPADAENARYLGVQPGSALLRVESLDTLEDGTPAEWGVSYFRGDTTKVRVEIREVKGEED